MDVAIEEKHRLAYDSYVTLCKSKGFSYDSLEVWVNHNYPQKRDKVLNKKVRRALNQQDHLSRNLRDGCFKKEV